MNLDLSIEELELLMISVSDSVMRIKELKHYYLNAEEERKINLDQRTKKYESLVIKISNFYVERNLEHERNNGTRPEEGKKTSESISNTQ